MSADFEHCAAADIKAIAAGATILGCSVEVPVGGFD
jgi:hypothetical protein